MSIKQRITSFIERLFKKKEEIKLIKESKEINKQENKKNNFVNSIKVNLTPNLKKHNVETLICKGDGLGIKNKISY